MNSLILAVKGFFMGIANIIPGVSGGTIAIILGIYERLISTISHIFKNFKDNLKFLIPLGLGMIIAIVSMSNLIGYSYDNYPIPTALFFVGLVIGGIPLLLKNVKGKKESHKISNYVIFLLTFSLVIFLALSDVIFGDVTTINLANLDVLGYIMLFIVGVIAAATMVIPGISGSLVLMLLGYYHPILKTITELTKFNNVVHNLVVAFVFGIGVIVGIVLVSKLLEMLFAKYKIKTYFGVLGFIFASIIAIPISTYLEIPDLVFNFPTIIIGLITLLIGLAISYKLGEK